MNSNVRPEAEFLDDSLVEYLVHHCALGEESAAQIREIMRTEHVRASEAAALSGLLTADQVEEALKYTARQEASRDGVIETALRRSTGQVVAKTRFDGPELKPGPELVFAQDPGNSRSEKIRALRTELLLMSNSATMMLAVVGSGPREGRSLLAAELALAFAQMDRRTLLVDADMRSPSQHRLFGTSNAFGLAQSIDGRHPGLYYRVSGFPTAALLTAGTLVSNPMELLSDLRFARLVNGWRRQFEFVVLDTPPIGLFADALTVATLAGRVLVVSRSVETSFKAVKDMLRRLMLTQSQVMGAVLNDF